MSRRSNQRARRRYRQAIAGAARAGIWTHDGFLGDARKSRHEPAESADGPYLDPRAVAVAEHVASEIARITRQVRGAQPHGNPWRGSAWQRGGTRTIPYGQSADPFRNTAPRVGGGPKRVPVATEVGTNATEVAARRASLERTDYVRRWSRAACIAEPHNTQSAREAAAAAAIPSRLTRREDDDTGR